MSNKNIFGQWLKENIEEEINNNNNNNNNNSSTTDIISSNYYSSDISDNITNKQLRVYWTVRSWRYCEVYWVLEVDMWK